MISALIIYLTAWTSLVILVKSIIPANFISLTNRSISYLEIISDITIVQSIYISFQLYFYKLKVSDHKCN